MNWLDKFVSFFEKISQRHFIGYNCFYYFTFFGCVLFSQSEFNRGSSLVLFLCLLGTAALPGINTVILKKRKDIIKEQEEEIYSLQKANKAITSNKSRDYIRDEVALLGKGMEFSSAEGMEDRVTLYRVFYGERKQDVSLEILSRWSMVPDYIDFDTKRRELKGVLHKAYNHEFFMTPVNVFIPKCLDGETKEARSSRTKHVKAQRKICKDLKEDEILGKAMKSCFLAALRIIDGNNNVHGIVLVESMMCNRFGERKVKKNMKILSRHICDLMPYVDHSLRKIPVEKDEVLLSPRSKLSE